MPLGGVRDSLHVRCLPLRFVAATAAKKALDFATEERQVPVQPFDRRVAIAQHRIAFVDFGAQLFDSEFEGTMLLRLHTG